MAEGLLAILSQRLYYRSSYFHRFYKRIGERNWTSLISPPPFDSEGLGMLETHMRSSAYDQLPGFRKHVECVRSNSRSLDEIEPALL